ncbi:MAG: DNA-binding protein WhiA [Lachnospiraceae bacterium]
MSFSKEVKAELAKQISTTRHCRIAELAAIIQYCGEIQDAGTDRASIQIPTENIAVARKYFTLLKKTFNIDVDAAEDAVSVQTVLQAIKIHNQDNHLIHSIWTVNPMIMKSSCCKRAVLRGAYLAVGSMSDPTKSYHFELACVTYEQAEQLRDLMREFQVESKIIERKKYYVVYVKEGSGIVELLNIIEAHVALMNLENLRIVKEMRNSINRRVNCEAANITKTVRASSKQIDDIHYIKEMVGFGNIPESLCRMAEIRLEHPDDTLQELGTFLNPPMGKSGVNHRLRKLSELADKLKQERGGKNDD